MKRGNAYRSFFLICPLNCVVVWLCLLVFVLQPTAAHSQQKSKGPFQPESKIGAEERHAPTCKIIYVGIVGGTETPNNSHSGVIKIRDILLGPAFPDVCAKSFSPYAWRWSGLHWILTHFPSHSGRLTKDELDRAPKVILVGHSLGGWAVLSVARNLKQKGIPVELCVQIDSVGITDHTVPANIKDAAIFHANDALFLLTTRKIKLENPTQTRLVENILVKDAGHWSVTRDPRVKDVVLCTVKSLGASQGQVSTCPFQSELQHETPATDSLPAMP